MYFNITLGKGVIEWVRESNSEIIRKRNERVGDKKIKRALLRVRETASEVFWCQKYSWKLHVAFGEIYKEEKRKRDQ